MSVRPESFTIYQGDTGPVLHPRPSVLDVADTLDANWHCYIAVNQKDGTSVVAKREVTDMISDSKRWIAALTPTETGTIAAGTGRGALYDMIIEVLNTSTVPPFNIETFYDLRVKGQGIT